MGCKIKDIFAMGKVDNSKQEVTFVTIGDTAVQSARRNAMEEEVCSVVKRGS
jgi:hypothetical protein